MAYYASAPTATGYLPTLPATGYAGAFDGGASAGAVMPHVVGRGEGAQAYMAARDHTLGKHDPEGAPAVGTRFWGVNVTRGDELAINMTAQIGTNLDAVTKMVMPLREHTSGTDFNYNITIPVPYVMPNVPNLAPAPRVADRFVQQSTSLSRHAMAFNMDSSAMINTERGKQLYLMKLQQIRDSTIRKMLIVIYNAMLTKHNASTIQSLIDNSGGDTWADSARERAAEDTFGIFQHDAFGFHYTEAAAKRVMDTMGTKPDVVLVPMGTLAYVNTTKARLSHSLMGPDKTPLSFAGIDVNKTKGGTVVIESVCMPTDSTSSPIDLLSRNVAIGEYVLMGLPAGRNRVGIEDQPNNTVAFINAEESLNASGLFHRESGELNTSIIHQYIQSNGGNASACVKDTPFVARTRTESTGTQAVIPNSFGAIDAHHLSSGVVNSLNKGVLDALREQLPDLAARVSDVDAFMRLAASAHLTFDVAAAAVAQNLLSGAANFAAANETTLHGMPDLNAGILFAFAQSFFGLPTATNGDRIATSGDSLFAAFGVGAAPVAGAGAGVGGGVGGGGGGAAPANNIPAPAHAPGSNQGKIAALAQGLARKMAGGKAQAEITALSEKIARKIAGTAIDNAKLPVNYGTGTQKAAAGKRISAAVGYGVYAGLNSYVSTFPAGYHSYTGMLYLSEQSPQSPVGLVYPEAVAAAQKAVASWNAIDAALSSAMPQSWLNSGDASSPAVMYADSASHDARSSLLFNSLMAQGASPMFFAASGAAAGGPAAGGAIIPAGHVIDETYAASMPSSVKYLPGGPDAANSSEHIKTALIGIGALNQNGQTNLDAASGRPTAVATAVEFATTSQETGMWLKMALANAWNVASPADKGLIKAFMEEWAGITTSAQFRSAYPQVQDMLPAISRWSVRVAVLLERKAGGTALPAAGTLATITESEPAKIASVSTAGAGSATISIAATGGNIDTVLAIGGAHAAPGTHAPVGNYAYKASPLLMNQAVARQSVAATSAVAAAAAAAGNAVTYAGFASEGVTVCGADPGSFPLSKPHIAALVTGTPSGVAAVERITKHRGSLLMGANAGAAAAAMSFGGSHMMSEDVVDEMEMGRGLLAGQVGDAFNQPHLEMHHLGHNMPWGIPLIARMSRKMLSDATQGTAIKRLSMAWIFGRFSVACIAGMAAAGIPVPFDICIARPFRTYVMGSLIFAQRDAGVTLHAHTVFKSSDHVQDAQIEGQFISHFGAAVLHPSRVYVAHDRIYLGALGGSGRNFFRHDSLPLPNVESAAAERREMMDDSSVYPLIVPVSDGNTRWDVTDNSFTNFLYKFGRDASPQPPMDSEIWSKHGGSHNTLLHPGYAVICNRDGTTLERQGTSPLGKTDPATSRGIRSGTMGRQSMGAAAY